MKASLLCALLLAAFTPLTFAAERSAACEAKRATIAAQISEAKSRGRSQEIAGLERALAANKARCTDSSLAKEREAHIRDAKKKVASREKSLAEAERKGDAEKIAARQAKLDEARSALTVAERPIGQ
jgi:hypothetical protein